MRKKLGSLFGVFAVVAALAVSMVTPTEAFAGFVGGVCVIATGATNAFTGADFKSAQYGEANWLKAVVFTVTGAAAVTGNVTIAMYNGGVAQTLYTSTNLFNGAAVRVDFGTNEWYTGRLRFDLFQIPAASPTTFTWKALYR